MNRLPIKYRPDDVRYEKISGNNTGKYLVLFIAVAVVLTNYLVNRKN